MSCVGWLMLFLTAQIVALSHRIDAADTSGSSGEPTVDDPASASLPQTPAQAPRTEAWTEAPPIPPPPPFPRPRRYGDKGTPELAFGLGYSSLTGFLAGGGFRYFVIDGVAPGVEGTYVSGGKGGSAYGLALVALRFVPLRTTSAALVVTARGGRVFLANHPDGWGIGGALGVLIMMSSKAGLEVGYEALRLFPASFCSDLRSCALDGLVLGLRLVL
jgi:hypothetical protein